MIAAEKEYVHCVIALWKWCEWNRMSAKEKWSLMNFNHVALKSIVKLNRMCITEKEWNPSSQRACLSLWLRGTVTGLGTYI